MNCSRFLKHRHNYRGRLYVLYVWHTALCKWKISGWAIILQSLPEENTTGSDEKTSKCFHHRENSFHLRIWDKVFWLVTESPAFFNLLPSLVARVITDRAWTEITNRWTGGFFWTLTCAESLFKALQTGGETERRGWEVGAECEQKIIHADVNTEAALSLLNFSLPQKSGESPSTSLTQRLQAEAGCVCDVWACDWWIWRRSVPLCSPVWGAGSPRSLSGWWRCPSHPGPGLHQCRSLWQRLYSGKQTQIQIYSD